MDPLAGTTWPGSSTTAASTGWCWVGCPAAATSPWRSCAATPAGSAAWSCSTPRPPPTATRPGTPGWRWPSGSWPRATASCPRPCCLLLGETSREHRPELVEKVTALILEQAPEAIAGAQRGMAARSATTDVLASIKVLTWS